MGLYVAYRRDAVHLRHPEVHQDDVGVQFAGHRDGLFTVTCLPDHLETWLAVDHAAQAGPHHRMVVGDQDTYAFVHRRSGQTTAPFEERLKMPCSPPFSGTSRTRRSPARSNLPCKPRLTHLRTKDRRTG